MKFEEYHINPKIKRALQEMGYKRPTDIQYKSIPNILKGEDLLAVAQTGTGKTAAFVIPLTHILYEKKKKERRKSDVNCIILTPTHELAEQIHEVIKKVSKYTTLRSMVLMGGVEQDPQIMKLYKGVDIIVATPGRVFDLINQKALLTYHIEILVLDEADHMLDLGFIKDIRDLIRKLPKRKQTLFFSATINDKIKKIAYSLVRQNAIRIQLSPKDPVAKKVEHAVMFIDMDDKRFFLERVVRDNPDAKIIAFVRTRVRAERVKKAMKRADIEGLTLHGEKVQAERTQILDDFKSGKCNLLIATDVAARGIDIPNVEIVINYDLPEEPEQYVHRVGRTGRGKHKGQAYSFCAEREKPKLEEIQILIHKDIKVIPIEDSEYQDTLHQELERNNDYETLMEEIRNFEKNKKRKKK